jgi:hypothetical protein
MDKISKEILLREYLSGALWAWLDVNQWQLRINLINARQLYASHKR